MATNETQVPSLVVELLQSVHGDQIASIEIIDSKGCLRPPATLPAIRVQFRPVDRVRLGRRWAQGVVRVAVYTKDEHPLHLGPKDFTTAGGYLQDRFADLLDRDVSIVGDRQTTTSKLPGGTMARVHTWAIYSSSPDPIKAPASRA